MNKNTSGKSLFIGLDVHEKIAVSIAEDRSFGGAREMQRDQPALSDKRSEQMSGARLEHDVRQFFQFDFVTPVIASGLLVDMPGLKNPSLRPSRE